MKTPIIFVYPLIKELKQLKDNFASDEKLEVYDVDNLAEANTFVETICPGIWVMNDAKKCMKFMAGAHKRLKNVHSKIILLLIRELPSRVNKKLEQVGVVKVNLPITQKALHYKVNLLIKALPQSSDPFADEEEKKELTEFQQNLELQRASQESEVVETRKKVISHSSLGLFEEESDNNDVTVIDADKDFLDHDSQLTVEEKERGLNLVGDRDGSSLGLDQDYSGREQVKNKNGIISQKKFSLFDEEDDGHIKGNKLALNKNVTVGTSNKDLFEPTQDEKEKNLHELDILEGQQLKKSEKVELNLTEEKKNRANQEKLADGQVVGGIKHSLHLQDEDKDNQGNNKTQDRRSLKSLDLSKLEVLDDDERKKHNELDAQSTTVDGSTVHSLQVNSDKDNQSIKKDKSGLQLKENQTVTLNLESEDDKEKLKNTLEVGMAIKNLDEKNKDQELKSTKVTSLNILDDSDPNKDAHELEALSVKSDDSSGKNTLGEIQRKKVSDIDLNIQDDGGSFDEGNKEELKLKRLNSSNLNIEDDRQSNFLRDGRSKKVKEYDHHELNLEKGKGESSTGKDNLKKRFRNQVDLKVEDDMKRSEREFRDEKPMLEGDWLDFGKKKKKKGGDILNYGKPNEYVRVDLSVDVEDRDKGDFEAKVPDGDDGYDDAVDKDDKPKVIIPDTRGLEYCLNILDYCYKKKEHEIILEEVAKYIWESKKGYTSFFYTDKKNQNHSQAYTIWSNQEVKDREPARNHQLEWDTRKNEKLTQWIDKNVPSWDDETFQATQQDFVFPFYEGLNRMGMAVVEFRYQIEEVDQNYIEVILESARNVFLDKYHNYGQADYGEKQESPISVITKFVKKVKDTILGFFGW